jgi:hypothetical protein
VSIRLSWVGLTGLCGAALIAAACSGDGVVVSDGGDASDGAASGVLPMLSGAPDDPVEGAIPDRL